MQALRAVFIALAVLTVIATPVTTWAVSDASGDANLGAAIFLTLVFIAIAFTAVAANLDSKETPAP